MRCKSADFIVVRGVLSCNKTGYKAATCTSEHINALANGKRSYKNNDFYKNAWKVFVENELIEKEFNAYFPKKFKAIGYIKCMEYLKAPLTTKKSDDKFHIVWKPRWVGTIGHSNLLVYLDYFSRFLYGNKNVDFVFYAHPLLKSKLISSNIMTERAYNRFFEQFTSMPNVRWEDGGDFLDLIMSADLFIGDVSSTIAEFALTGKPIIYTPTEIEFNDFGNEILRGMYVVNTPKEMDKLIYDIMQGIDPLHSVRHDNIKYISTPYNSENIIPSLINFLKSELKREKQSALFSFKKLFHKN